MQNMSDKILPINEIYTCLQGEGKLMGIPHILIRVSGCRLRCQFANSFCDTPYSSWKPEKGKFTYDDVRNFYEKQDLIQFSKIWCILLFPRAEAKTQHRMKCQKLKM